MSATLQSASGPSSFGCRYAVLNLDLMSILIDAAKDTAEGQAFISNCVRWNDAVHAKKSRPLTIFTSLFFSHRSQAELAVNENAPFTQLVRNFNAIFENGSHGVQIDPLFVVDEQDIILQKTRWYAGTGNALEQILRAQNIDTVVISGLTLSGVVMSTIYRLFDLDYNIFVVSDNVMEFPGDDNLGEVSSVMLSALLKRMNLRELSLEEALQALVKS